MRFLMSLAILLPLAVFPQKRAYKKGLAFEKQGEVILAMDLYKKALYKNMYYAQAKAGLERCANASIESLLSGYFIARQKNDWQDAESIFEKIETIRDEMTYFSIEIDLPDYQKARIEQDRLRSQEEQENKLAADWQQEMEFRASKAFSKENYFLAYSLYDSLLAMYPENKDYLQNLDHSKREGGMTLAVIALENTKNRHTKALKTAILSELSKWSHPLMTMMEREDLDALVNEQKRAFTGLFDESSTPSPGMLKGVKHLLVVRLEDIEFKRQAGKTVFLSAYERVRTKVFDASGNWRVKEQYLPREYSQKTDRASMAASLHYKLIELETGRILTAMKLAGIVEDEVMDLTYKGESATLYPMRNGEIVITGNYVNEFRALFTAQKILKSEQELFLALERQLATKAVMQLKAFLVGGGL